ncbi:uncharacterized short protein YbdD (DUF466 family) [Sphingomonas zeicaulis]|uniref:YbdD/YjiX family protein n=1 Tax=Sphingomonas zeicaulis TaxID=1632740 RepID=UPI003D1C1CF0
MNGWIALIGETARLMVGMPSYEAYCRHMAEHHPDQPVMTRTAFFRDRQQARYGGRGGGRCC